MKKILSLFLLVAATGNVNAQKVEDIIAKYDKAIGGIEAQKKVKTMKMTAKIKQMGMEFPLLVQVIGGKAVRSDVTIQGMTIVSAFKDSTGWTINPLQGATTAQKMNAEEVKESKKQCDLVDELADYKGHGHKVELIGKEDVEGTETYKIKLTKKDGDIEYYYLDAESYLPIKTASKIKYGDKEVETETYFSDYKDVNGIKRAHNTQVKSGGQVFMETVIEKFEVNVPIDEDIFKMPQ